MEATLGVVAVEDDAVERDGHDLDYNFNQDADKDPVVQAADESIVDFVAIEIGTSILATATGNHSQHPRGPS